MTTYSRCLFLTLSLGGLAGCSHNLYTPPQSQVAPLWSSVSSSHEHKLQDLTQWWAQFNDPVLSRLIEQAQQNSPDLLKAWARIEQARASLTTSKAGLLPSLTGSGNAKRSKDGGQINNQRSGSLDASWEIDLFGRIKNQSEAAIARVEARQEDWHDARISLAAEVADDYVQYHSCQTLVAIYQHELSSMQKTEHATAQMVKAGFTAPMDGALTRANLASTQMTLFNQQKQCDVLIKTLVQVTGIQENDLRPLLDQGKARLPVPRLFAVSSMPIEVIQQRPDLAALEREVYATYAEIGVAQADRYPRLSLTGAISTAVTAGISASTWSFGPALSLPIFDAGQKKAAVNSAKASYIAAVADYQSGVRKVVSEVEQTLVQLNSIAAQEQASKTSVKEYENYFQSLNLSWKAGKTNLLDLESARRSSLSAQVSQIELQTSRLQQWIALYKAVGGGWQKNTAVTQSNRLLNDPNL